MRMIPEQPLLTNSRAEMLVFDQLRAAFSGRDHDAWFAIHSLNLPRHEYKRFGEVDFVVCGPEGLFVLEIKGGGLACRNGIWETKNRFGETTRLQESPFRQAEGALHGLRLKLPPSILEPFVLGYGVITPDTRELPPSAEWEQEVFADARDFKQFEQWLTRLIRHWRSKSPRTALASSAQLEELRALLRPDFAAQPAPHCFPDPVVADEQAAGSVQEQVGFVEQISSCQRAICRGGAGTGKTMLGLALARHWSAAGMETVMICHSPWLKSRLERSPLPGLTVCLPDSVALAAKRAGVEHFDALIVDALPSIAHTNRLAALDARLAGGLRHGRWCVFHDPNSPCDSFAVEQQFSDLAATELLLAVNYRNSLPIVQQIEQTLQADLGRPASSESLPVRELVVGHEKTAIKAIERELDKLIGRGFSYHDIVILSPRPFKESLASSLSPEWRALVARLDSASPRSANRSFVGFAEINNYQGLESEAVILVDLPPPGTVPELRPLHYIGMSRARSALSMICIPPA